MNWFIHETAVVSSFTQHIIFMLKVAVVLITAIEHYALVLSVHIPCDYWDKKRTGGGGDICHRANQCPPTPLTSWPLTLPDMKTLFTRSPPIFPIFLELYFLLLMRPQPYWGFPVVLFLKNWHMDYHPPAYSLTIFLIFRYQFFNLDPSPKTLKTQHSSPNCYPIARLLCPYKA